MHKLISAAFVSVVLVLSACAPSQPPVRIGVLVWPPYELAFLAASEGLYPADAIKLVDFQTPAEVVRAYRYGLIDGMFLTTQFVLDSKDLPATARLVYILNTSQGGDSVLAKPEIETLAQIKGATVGIEAGPLGAYMLRRVLDHAGLEPEDITLVFVDTPDQFRAFQQERIDVVVTYEPTRRRLLNDGATELFNSRQLPDEICDVLLVSEQVLQTRSATLKAFVTGLSNIVQAYPGLAPEKLRPLAERENLSVEDYRQAMAGTELLDLAYNRTALTGNPPPLAEKLAEQLAVMARATVLEEPIHPARLIDSRLVE